MAAFEHMKATMLGYLAGQVSLEAALAEALELREQDGWGPYFDHGRLDPEMEQRAKEFEARFAAAASLAVTQKRRQPPGGGAAQPANAADKRGRHVTPPASDVPSGDNGP